MEAATNVGWFGLPARTSLSQLLRALDRAGYLAGPSVSSRYECIFVEAQDGRLAKAGCRLAVRRGGKTLTWQFSGPEGASQASFEGDASFRSVSSDAVGIPTVSTLVAGRRLLFPLVHVRVSSHEARLKSPGGDELILCAERFRSGLPGGDGSKLTPPQGILAVTFLEGDPNAFLHLATYLRDRLGLLASSGDACSMALQSLGLPEPGAPLPAHLRIRPEDPMALAARKVVGQQALKMRANIQGTLEDMDPEYLHDLRVAARRLRSALRFFDQILGAARCASLRVELSWISHFLGAVRDLDVFIPTLKGQTQRLGEAGVVAELLAEELERQRVAAREILGKALASPRFSSFMRRLEALASSTPPRHPRGARRTPVSREAPTLIWKAQRRVLRLGRALGPESPVVDLHRLRILFKRLRYASEFFREAFIDPVSGEDPLSDYIQAMVQFQDCLGEHQDAVVAMARIQDLAKDMVQRGGLAPERLLDLGGVIQVQREITRERRGRLAKLWSRFDRHSVRRRLRALWPKAPQASESGKSPEPPPASRMPSPGGPSDAGGRP